MSRDPSSDDFPFDVDELSSSAPSVSGSVPSPGPIALLVVALACLVVAWYVRPWLQPLVYGLYSSPGFVLVCLLALASLIALTVGGSPPGRGTIRTVLTVGFVGFLVVSTVGGWYAGATLS